MDAIAAARWRNSLATAHWSNVESRDAVKTYNKRALGDVGKEFPRFDWFALSSELGIRQAQSLVILQPSYVKAFAAAVDGVPMQQ